MYIAAVLVPITFQCRVAGFAKVQLKSRQGLQKLKAPLISIVDDDEPNREAIEALIRSLGYSAATFASAEEYLRSGCVHSSSCLITDLQMPGMSGADLQERLIADGRKTPIIFLTAFSEDRIRARVLNAGALCFLSKPFNDECLIQCLHKALKSPRVSDLKFGHRSCWPRRP